MAEGRGSRERGSARARAPLTSATARRRAALLTTVASQLLFYIHEREQRETKGGDSGARAESARRRSDARRHLAGHAGGHLRLLLSVCRRSKRDENSARPTLTDGENTVTEQATLNAVVLAMRIGSCFVPWSERGCVWWWRSGGPCCQAARERRGPGMAGSCSTLRCGRCGRPRRALHATGPRTARARARPLCARTPALAAATAPRL